MKRSASAIRPSFGFARWPSVACAIVGLALGAPSVSAKQVDTKTARVIIFGAFGTPKNIVVSGRVVEDIADEGQAERGRIANVKAALDVLETDEVRRARVSANLDGIWAHGTTDDDGLFFFRFRPRKTIAPGEVPLRIELRSKTHHSAKIVRTAHVVGDVPSLGIISDFDDTLVNTYVDNKAKLAFEIMTKNAAQLTPVPGGSAAFQRAKDAGAAAFFYVSSSPQSFADRIRVFLRREGFPDGAILLKNYGAEKLFAHHGYKTRRIEAILETFPKMRFILVGDSGEADPVIYRDLRKKYPGRIEAIVIRKASAKALPEAMAPVTFVPDYRGQETVLSDLVRTAIEPTTAQAPPREKSK